jgi:hypothetical protein
LVVSQLKIACPVDIYCSRHVWSGGFSSRAFHSANVDMKAAIAYKAVLCFLRNNQVCHVLLALIEVMLLCFSGSS